jgi:leader peptidase (prepilin peptidase)/N-methyltransferase
MFINIIILATLVLASISDIKNKTVPMWMIIIPGLVSLASSAYRIFFCIKDVTEIGYSLIPGLFLILIAFIARGAMGYGDGIMLIAVAPAFGVEKVCFGLMLALFLSAASSIILLIAKKAGRHTSLPFIPFLTIGLGGASIAFL